jgi:hypothetical protein
VVDIGTGPNRMELYPIRGASTERQYIVYFPERRLLYVSDTLVINPDKTLYDPELMYEVRQAVEREHLTVDTVYAMHQGRHAGVGWNGRPILPVAKSGQQPYSHHSMPDRQKRAPPDPSAAAW